MFIGDNTIVEPDVLIIDSDCHSLNYKDRGTEMDMVNKVNKPVYIGCNVLIGERSIINKGVVIGDGAIVKPGSIVTSDIPANCIAEGCPAKVLST